MAVSPEVEVQENQENSLEKELIEKVGILPPEDRTEESMNEYREVLVRAISDMDDDEYEALSDAAKDWSDAGVICIERGKPVVELDPEKVVKILTAADDSAGAVVEDEKELEDTSAWVDVDNKVKKEVAHDPAVEPAKKDKAGRGNKRKTKKDPIRQNKPKSSVIPTAKSRPSTKSTGWLVKEIFLDYKFKCTMADMEGELMKRGKAMSPHTVKTIGYEFKQALAVLKARGLLKDPDQFGLD